MDKFHGPFRWSADQNDIPRAEKMLLMMMCRCGNASFHSYMSMEAMMLSARMDIRTVRKALTNLEAAGKIIECVPKIVRGKRYRQFRLLAPGRKFDRRDPPLLPKRTDKTARQNLKRESESESVTENSVDKSEPKPPMQPKLARSVAECLPAEVQRIVDVRSSHKTRDM